MYENTTRTDATIIKVMLKSLLSIDWFVAVVCPKSIFHICMFQNRCTKMFPCCDMWRETVIDACYIYIHTLYNYFIYLKSCNYFYNGNIVIISFISYNTCTKQSIASIEFLLLQKCMFLAKGSSEFCSSSFVRSSRTLIFLYFQHILWMFWANFDQILNPRGSLNGAKVVKLKKSSPKLKSPQPNRLDN